LINMVKGIEKILYLSFFVVNLGGVVTRVIFRYDKNVTDNLPYTQKYEFAENWTYGYFMAY